MTWTYSVIYQRPNSDPDHPKGLLRHRQGADEDQADTLDRYGGWRATDFLIRMRLGMEYERLQPVSQGVAIVHARRWQAIRGWATLPDDLTEDLPREAADEATDDPSNSPSPR